jgi:hypothetical protein
MPRELVSPAPESDFMQPQAQPVQSFVTAAHDNVAGTQLAQLATSMTGLSSELDTASYQTAMENKQRDFQAGKEAYFKNNSEGFAEGIASGSIPANATPFFRRVSTAAQFQASGAE